MQLCWLELNSRELLTRMGGEENHSEKCAKALNTQKFWFQFQVTSNFSLFPLAWDTFQLLIQFQ